MDGLRTGVLSPSASRRLGVRTKLAINMAALEEPGRLRGAYRARGETPAAQKSPWCAAVGSRLGVGAK